MGKSKASENDLGDSAVPKKRQKWSQISTQGNSSMDSEADDIDVQWAGRIERLQMQNFMCHTNLEIVFNPRINFISGNNGSGKSAVVAALVVVLGGTAVTTGRAHGIGDFIKTGESSGKITIILLNHGFNAYKPDIFGSRIIIVRSFTSKSSSYIIKSETGAIISKKKGEVDKIRDFLQLQIKNPICILNQDVARSFLTTADSKVLYELFMQATQLSNLLDLYLEAADKLKQAKADLAWKVKLMEGAKKELDELTNKLQLITELEKMIVEKTNLENEFVWAGVIAEEREVREIVEEQEVFEAKINEIKAAVSNHQSGVDCLADEMEQIKNELASKSGEKKEAVKERSAVYESLMTLEQSIVRAEMHINTAEPSFQRITANMQKLLEAIDQIDESNNKCIEEESRLKERILVVQENIKEILDRTESARRDLANANETKVQYLQNLEEFDGSIREQNRAKAHKQTQLDSMRGKEDWELLRFGNFMPKLLHEIDCAVAKKRFAVRPVGPCGMYIKLNCDVKWAPAIESMIGGLMQAFCCDNVADFKTLSNIMSSVVNGQHPQVIISRFQKARHNLGEKHVKVRGHSAIIDVITVSHDVVFNALIDQASVEGILLFETDSQAAAMLTHIENVPKGLRMGVTLNCDRYHPAPNYRTYAVRSRPARFFGNDTQREDVVKKLEREISQMETEYKDKLETRNKLKTKLEKLNNFSQRAEARLREFREMRVKLDIELNQLNDQQQSLPVPRTRVALEEELKMLQAKKAETEKELAKKKEEFNKLKRSKDEIDSKYACAKESIRKIEQSISKLEADLEEKKDALNAQNALRRNADAQLESLRQKVQQSNEKIASAKVELEQRKEEAIGICPRVNTTRSPAQIQKLLEKHQRNLKVAEKNTGSKEDTINEYKIKRERYDELRCSQSIIESSIQYLISSIVERQDRYTSTRALTAQAVAQVFRTCLTARGYDGIIKFNFDENKLELEVHPQEDPKDSRTDTKTLSGGERSYATVSLILAIWRTVRMPFYFLDEFDVFMDKVNRKIIMDLLMENAKESAGTQFVFITPLDISSVIASDIISLYKMPDPVRPR